MTTRKMAPRTAAGPDPRGNAAAKAPARPSTPLQPQPVPLASTPLDDLIDRAWRLLSSLHLALILLLAIAAAALAGTLLVQVPAGVETAADYAAWLQQVRPKYGALTDLLSALGLLSVFGSLWFRLLLGVLILNVVICTVNRWQGLWQSIARPRVRMGESFFQQAGNRASWTTSDRGAGERVQEALRRRRYRVLVEQDGPTTYVYADRNRFGKLGTFASHLSIVLLLAGTVSGGLWGFRSGDFVVPEGATRPVGHGTNLAVKLERFADEYYPEGGPKDYMSDVVLYDSGQEVRRETIRVNEPLVYGGVRFHQAFFGPAAVVEVRDGQGQVIFADPVALPWRREGDERAVGVFTVPSTGQVGQLVAPRSGAFDSQIPAGQLQLQVFRDAQARVPSFVGNLVQGRWTRVDDLEFRFVQERQFTGLQVVYDPGGPVVWLAAALFVLGLMSVFYFPHQRVWALCRETESGTQVLVGSPTKGSAIADVDWQRLTSDLRG